MRQLVALAERVGPRVEEGDQPLQPVGRGDQHRRQRRRAASAASPRNSRQSSPPTNRMPNAIATITTSAPKSGSSSSEPAGRDHHREQRQEAPDQRLPQRLLRVQERRLAHRVARRVDDDRELHELRRLQVDHDERQPAPRSRSPICRCRGRAPGPAARRRRMNSHGASACHALIGTWKATTAATAPAPTKMAWRTQEVPRAVARVRTTPRPWLSTPSTP